jgi:hypothetical protein
VLQFKLPEHISRATADSVKTAMRFLALHEIFHVSRRHAMFLSSQSLSIVDEDLTLHELEMAGHSSHTTGSQSKKAVEIDADGRALHVLLQEKFSGLIVNLEEAIFSILCPVYIFISTFDLCRRSLRDYQGSTHPVPDLRAWMATQLAVELLAEEGIDLRHPMHAAQERAVIYSVRSFQQLGIPSGAFYILANRLVSLDRQFPNQLAANLMLNDELRAIEASLRELERSRSGRILPVRWQLPLFGLGDVEVRETAKKWALRILRNATRPDVDSASEEPDGEAEDLITRHTGESGPSAAALSDCEQPVEMLDADAGSDTGTQHLLLFRYAGCEEDGSALDQEPEPQDENLPSGGPSSLSLKAILGNNLKRYVKENGVSEGDFVLIHNDETMDSPYLDPSADKALRPTEEASKYADAMRRSFVLLFDLAGAKMSIRRTTPILGG